MKNPINKFRLIALLEGLSYITLLFIAMPLKYMYGIPEAVRIVGMTHGILFMAYLVLQGVTSGHQQWDMKTNTYFFLASLIPFATFFADRRLKAMEAR